MIYLNGKLVKEEEINPEKHKFIGLFRSPTWPVSDGIWEVYPCQCMQHLWTVQACQEHWRLGHMDTPQYIDIKGD